MITESIESIRDETHLEELLSEPTAGVVKAVSEMTGDFLLLGAGGKMGYSLARMARRASEQAGIDRRVVAVSRFTEGGKREALHRVGVETIAGDLLDESFLNGLPEMANVIFMTGAKFGTAGDATKTWAMNVWLPGLVSKKFRQSRLGAFSTGNVYPLVSASSGGSCETDAVEPVGEYGYTALGRERMFSYFSQLQGTRLCLARLNYAVEMRYGVLVDLARQVLAGNPIDITMGYANVLWQGDANAMMLQAMADANDPPFVVNIAGPEIFAVRDVCLRFGELMKKQVAFVGQPADTALLNNGSFGHGRYGMPRVTLECLQRWIADWLLRGNAVWNKPTRFEVRNGKF